MILMTKYSQGQNLWCWTGQNPNLEQFFFNFEWNLPDVVCNFDHMVMLWHSESMHGIQFY